VEIRELGPDDAAAFWELRLRGFREDPTSFGYSFDEASREPVALERRSPDDVVLGAFEAGRLGAIAGLERPLRRKRAHRAVLWGMNVAPELRGRGVARALAVELIARARRIDGVERINLTVMAHNDAAIRLYRSLGFEPWGREPGAMKLYGVQYDELSMALVL